MASETIPSSRDTASDDDDEEEAAAEAGGGGGWTEMCWRIGKKVAIAGAALTTAPIVIPSYCVASTLALALSVPFGFYLATVAATDKIMSSLLPLSSLPSPDELEEELEEEWKSVDLEEEEEGEEEERAVITPPESEELLTTARSLESEMDPSGLSSEYASAMAAAEEEEEKEEPLSDAKGHGFVEVEPSMVVKTQEVIIIFMNSLATTSI